MFQKKKIEEPIPEPLSVKEIKILKDKLEEKEDLDNLSIKDLKIKDIIPQNIKNVIILELDGRHTIVLPENMEKNKFKTWRKSKGGIFNTDVLNYLRDKKHGQYVLIGDKTNKHIVRLIEDDELHLFQALKLVNGVIKDKAYMLLRTLGDKERLTNTKTLIINPEFEEEEVETMTIDQAATIKPEDDHEPVTSSVSLFN